MSDDLEYLARREREREQEEKREEQAEKEARWEKGEEPRLAFGIDPEYEAWKERTGYKEPSGISVLVFVWAVVIGLFVFFLLFGPS